MIAEEAGLFGTVAVLAMYGVFFWRGVTIAIGASEGFGHLLATGIDDDDLFFGAHQYRCGDGSLRPPVCDAALYQLWRFIAYVEHDCRRHSAEYLALQGCGS